MSKKGRFFTFCLATLLLFGLCSCDTAEEKNPYQDLLDEAQDTATQEPEAQRTLTLAITGEKSEYNYLYNFATAYMSAHPDTLVQVEEITPGVDDAALSTRLMAGSAPDVLATLATSEILNSGHLVDLYPFMREDPEFREEDYFMNVISAVEDGGHLYALAYSFLLRGVYAMRSDLDAGAAAEYEEGNATFADMLHWYQELGADRNLQFSEVFGADEVFTYYADSTIDIAGKSCDFQMEELRPVIELAQTIPAPNVTYSLDQGIITYVPGGNMLASERLLDTDSPYLFMECDVINDPELLFPYEGRLYTQPHMIRSAGGNYLYEIGAVLMMTDSCKDRALAWDFIKFCMTDRTEPYEGLNSLIGYQMTVGPFPTTNRNNFASQCRLNVENKYDYSVEMGQVPQGEREQVINNAVAYLTTLPDCLEVNISPYLSILDITWEDRCLYYLGNQSLDVTLKNMQSKIQVYLNE